MREAATTHVSIRSRNAMGGNCLAHVSDGIFVQQLGC